MKEDHTFIGDYNEITDDRKKGLIQRLKNTIYKGGIAHYQIFVIGKSNIEIEFIYEWLKENNIKIRGQDGTVNYEN